MKTITINLIAVMLLTNLLCSGQSVSIPDSNFGNWLNTHGYAGCLTGNSTAGWQMDTICPTVINTTQIICQGQQIGDLTGISYFKNLQILRCDSNLLVSLPTLPEGLTELSCDSNALTVLPALPAGLRSLQCGSNYLTTLTVLPDSLRILSCNRNQLTNLPVLPDYLTYLSCYTNFLTFLPALPGLVVHLDCGDNQLSALPSLPPTLRTLICMINPIPALPSLPDSLQYLDCFDDQLATLPTLPAGLTHLSCPANNLTMLPMLPDSLVLLYCSQNMLSSLPTLPSTLIYLACGHNTIPALPLLPGTLTYLECRYTGLNSLPTLPESLINIYCAGNQISSMPILSHNLEILECDSNPALSCLPYIYPHLLNVFFIAGTNIQCIPDSFMATFYDIDPATMTICGNGNSNGCTVYRADSLVWPGDADHNGIADNNDLLPIGIAYGLNGPVRPGASIVWIGQSATDWGLLLLSGTNIKHVDCNGDGIINADDTIPIIQNFNLTHNKTGPSRGPWRSGAAEIRTVLSKDTLYAGDTLTVSFELGDSITPAANIYGIAFTYNFDPLVVDSAYTSMSFGNSWMGNATDKISLSKTVHNAGQIKAALTRIDHVSRSGNGSIAEAKFKITTDNISGKDFVYYSNAGFISDVMATDQLGNIIQINEGADTSQVGYTPTGITETAVAMINVHPNPASDKVTITSDNIIKEVTITDMLGKEILHENNAYGKSVALNIALFEKGVYLIKVSTGSQSGISKLVVSK